MGVFLGMSLLGIVSSCLFKEIADNQPLPYNQLLVLKILAFITYAVMACFTYKGIKIASLLMGAIILLTGIHVAFLGICRIGWHQYFLKPYFTVFGLYLIFGGIVLSRLKNRDLPVSASRRAE